MSRGEQWPLTNLDNARPTWLDLAHKRLDEAVFAAYGWPSALSDEEILGRSTGAKMLLVASAWTPNQELGGFRMTK